MRAPLALVLTLALALVMVLSAAAAAGWSEDLDALLRAEPGDDRDALLERVLRATPDPTAVLARLEALTFPSVRKGETFARTVRGTDGVDRPYAVHVPSSYDPGRRTPLLVVLHGGVSRETILEDPVAYAKRSPFHALAEQRGWLVVWPMGQAGATWWDEVGMGNIRSIVRRTKRDYNVDDDRVWMEGFSDGASAAFLHAMLVPTDYAAFVALNGHMGVGSLVGDLPCHAPNFANRPVYAVTTDRDGLYPSDRMRTTIEMARRAGGRILYREHEGPHDFVYAEEELPRIARFLERHPRDPLPTRIVWEASEPAFGRCDWFAIDRVTANEPAPWHRDHNAALVDDRVSVGFFPAEHEGPGMGVGSVVEDSFAGKAGLRPGDVIVEANGTRIARREDLDSVKASLRRGDRLTLVVERDGTRTTLEGRLPPPKNYNLFKRDRPSAMARVSFSANRVDIEASRLGGFRIHVHPDLVRPERNLVVRVNGETVFDEKVETNLRFLLANFLEHRDRRLLYIARVVIEPAD